MQSQQIITFEAVLSLVKRLSLADQLRLLEWIMTQIKQMVMPTVTENVSPVKLGGLWKTIPFDIDDNDVRTLRQQINQHTEERIDAISG